MASNLANFEPHLFDQKLRAGLDLIYEAFAMVDLDFTDENTISDAIDAIERVAQDVTGPAGFIDD
jgi:hypothetical protein